MGLLLRLPWTGAKALTQARNRKLGSWATGDGVNGAVAKAATELLLSSAFMVTKNLPLTGQYCSSEDICRVREVPFRLILIRTLCQESCVARVAIS